MLPNFRHKTNQSDGTCFFLLDDRQAGGKFILNDLIRALTFFRLRQGLWNNQTGFQVTCEHSLDLFFILDYVFK